MPQSSPHFARLLPVSWVLAYLPGPCSYLCICCFCLCHDYLDLFQLCLLTMRNSWNRNLLFVVFVADLDTYSWIHFCLFLQLSPIQTFFLGFIVVVVVFRPQRPQMPLCNIVILFAQLLGWKVSRFIEFSFCAFFIPSHFAGCTTRFRPRPLDSLL